jgi:hypothetical protein
MSSNQIQYTPSALGTAKISFLAMLPFAIPLILFFSNMYPILMYFEYAGMFIIFGVPIVLLAIHFSIEVTIRFQKLTGHRKFPWFTLVATLGLIAFFFIGEFIKPLVQLNPSFCRCWQDVEWTTGTKNYVSLSLVGTGNKSSYRFEGGGFTWGKNASSSTSRRTQYGSVQVLRLQPTRFGEYYQEAKDMMVVTPDVLRKKLSYSDMQEDELESIVASVWEVMKQIDAGQPLTSNLGHVSKITARPDNNIEHVCGGWLLIIVLVGVYQIVGQKTIREPVRHPAE